MNNARACLQGGLIPFEIGVSVVGDVTIAVWLGDHNMGGAHSHPALLCLRLPHRYLIVSKMAYQLFTVAGKRAARSA